MHSRFELIGSSDEPEFDLVSLATLKLELGVTTATEDILLQARITRESGLIAEICDRVFALSDAVETFTFDRDEVANPRQALCLRLYPVTEVVSIEVGGTEIEASTYEVDKATGRLWLTGGSWSGTIVVTYSGGYALPDGAPSLLASAVIQSVRDRRLSVGRDPTIRDVTHGDAHVGYFSEPTTAGALSSAVMELIRSFRRLAMA